jgi:alpha-tubulin suppressor-like RCC1 family protein
VAGSDVTVTAQLADANGNPVSTAGLTVTWASTNGGSFADPTSTTDANGEATVVFTTNTTAGTDHTVTADDGAQTGTSVVFTTQAGAAAQYLVTSSDNAPPAGSDVTITAQLADANGNPVSTGGLTVTWASTNGGSFADPTSITDANGVATVVFTTNTAAGTDHTVTADDGAQTGTSVVFTTQVGAAAQYLVTSSDNAPPAGSDVTITAQLADANGNPVSTAGLTVTWASTNGGSFADPTSTTDANGEVTVVFTTNTAAGTDHTVTATDDSSPTPLTGTSAVFTTVVGAASQYLVTSSDNAPPAGSDVTITAQLADANGNPVSTAGLTVTWASTNGGSFADPTSLTDANGVATVVFTTNASVATIHTVTANDGSVSGTSAAFRTGANRYVIVDPIDGTAGTPVPVTVRAEDQFGTVDVQEQRDVRLVASGSASAGAVDIINGVGTIDVTDNTAETVILTLSDDVENPPTGLDVSSTQDLTFSPAAVAYAILDPVDGTVNTPVTVTVEAQDQSGEVDPTINGSVTLRASGSATPTTSLVTITNGVGTTQVNDAVSQTVDLTLENPTPSLDVSSTQDVVFFPEGDWTMVALGRKHACGLTSLGTVYCWGDNTLDQLGDNGASGPSSNVPVAVAGGLTFTTVDAGDDHACALTAGGAAYCWGDNSLGQLGDDGVSGATSPVPVAVSGGLTFASVSAATEGFHTCGVTTTDVAYCWGSDSFGQLGNGPSNDGASSPVPVPVSGGLTFQSISTGSLHSCGIVSDNTARCWGAGSPQLGTGSDASSNVPVAVVPPLGETQPLTFTTISAGRQQTCGLTTGGDGYCWGENFYGQLGDGTNTRRFVPTLVLGGLTFGSLMTGVNQTCGVAGGEGYCWGLNDIGALGDGTTVSKIVPTPTYGQVPFAQMDGGQGFICGVTVANTGAYCWGRNTDGQLGSGSTAPNSLIPVRVSNP